MIKDIADNLTGNKDFSQPSPGLYLVATPIGNKQDISLRALSVLRHCDYVACEDKRHTGGLLSGYGFSPRYLSYNDQADARTRENIITKIQDGASVALVSDAGMPLIADPGYKLVRACHEAGVAVTTIPGASAVLGALQLSGLPTDHFTFAGFLPAKKKARRVELSNLARLQGTLVLFEAPRRLLSALGDIRDAMPDRRVAVVRELTKLFEEVQTGTPAELLDYYEAAEEPKGEIVLVIEGRIPDKDSSQLNTNETLDEWVAATLSYMSASDVARFLAERFDIPKNEIYERANAIKNKVK